MNDWRGLRCERHERGGLMLNAFGKCECGKMKGDTIMKACRDCSREQNICEYCGVDL